MENSAPSSKRSLRQKFSRSLIGALAFLAGIWLVPHRWCAREADDWFAGKPDLQFGLAHSVAAWVTNDLSRSAFTTGSAQFNGEWLFGTYLMAGFGFGQTAVQQPAERNQQLLLMTTCIERILSPEVRQFDREMWHHDPLDTLDRDDADHAAFLGYFNLLLSFHRQLAPQSEFAPLNDRITGALIRRLERSPLLLLQSYPAEVYPVDNCAVIASIGLHGQATGQDHARLLQRWADRCRADYLDPQTGLLIQCVNPNDGTPADAPRGSGTALGQYFLSFADRPFARQLYAAAHRELAGTFLGFGVVREYPRGVHGEGDIDSGPIILGYSISATGFLISGARTFDDRDTFRRLLSTTYLFGAPLHRSRRFDYVTGGPLGNAILFAMLTAPRP